MKRLSVSTKKLYFVTHKVNLKALWELTVFCLNFSSIGFVMDDFA